MENFEDIINAKAQESRSRRPNEPFDRDEFAARKKRERDEVYAMVDEFTGEMQTDGGAFQTYLDVQSHFDRYSATNAILIAAQMPEATRLMDFDGWKDAGVYVRRGAEAITILEPKEFTREEDGSTGVFYNPKKVFDVSQTTMRQPPVMKAKRDTRVLLKALIENAPCGFAVSTQLPENVNARYDASANTIYVRPGLDGDNYIRGVSQELAKAHMDHDNMELASTQFAAYCVSYMVSARYGVSVEGYNFNLLPKSYREMNAQELRVELGKVREISGDMLSDMRHSLDNMEKAQKQKDNEAR